jgi:Skp family chaperone for outer membrane proteins
VAPTATGLFVLVTLASAASAQTLKVGVFDKQRIVDESKLGLASKTRFEKLQAEREAEVSEKQKSYETLQASFQQKAQVLSDEKKLELQRDLARARDEWQSAGQNAERDLQRAYQTALMDIVSKIDPIIEDYGKSEGFDLLFDKAQLAFNRPTLEVTDALIAKLNLVYPQ